MLKFSVATLPINFRLIFPTQLLSEQSQEHYLYKTEPERKTFVQDQLSRVSQAWRIKPRADDQATIP
jgi:hypothetical protein